MGYNKESFRKIRSSFEDKAERAREDARVRRQLLWREIPELKEIDSELSTFGLRIMRSALDGKGSERMYPYQLWEREYGRRNCFCGECAVRSGKSIALLCISGLCGDFSLYFFSKTQKKGIFFLYYLEKVFYNI